MEMQGLFNQQNTISVAQKYYNMVFKPSKIKHPD